MAGVIAEGDGLAVRRAHAALGAENEKLFAGGLGGLAHAGILAEAEDVAAGAVEQHVFGDGEAAGRAGGMALDLVDFGPGRKDFAKGHGRD